MKSEVDGKWSDIALSFRYEKDLLDRWLRQTAGRQRRSTVYILILALLAVNFVIVIPTSANKAAPSLMAGVCVAAIVFIVAATKSKRGAQTVEGLYRGGEEYRVILRGDGLSYRCGGAEETIGYGDRFRVREHEQYFALHYRRDGLFLLPKSAMTEAQSARLGHFYAEKLGGDYRLCNK